MPSYRRFGIKIITWAYNFGNRVKVTDSLLCLRAYTKEALDGLIIEEDGFGHCPEALIKARKRGLRIKEIPAHCHYHEDYRRNSTLGPFKLAAILIWKILVWRLRIEYGLDTRDLLNHWRRRISGKPADKEVVR